MLNAYGFLATEVEIVDKLFTRRLVAQYGGSELLPDRYREPDPDLNRIPYDQPIR